MLIFAASLSRAVNEGGPLPYIRTAFRRAGDSAQRISVRHRTDLRHRLAVTLCVNDPGVQFMSAGAHSGLSAEYDNFLYSAISDDTNQIPVSVLSVLARHDIDPWHEAAQLAQMPKTTAIARLASMISSVNLDLTPQSSAEIIATRLIELLPMTSAPGASRRVGIPHVRPGSRLAMIAGIAIGLLLLALMVFGN
jgi:hypothetical protein